MAQCSFKVLVSVFYCHLFPVETLKCFHINIFVSVIVGCSLQLRTSGLNDVQCA